MIRRLFNLVLEGRCVFNLAQLFMSSIELPGSWVDHGVPPVCSRIHLHWNGHGEIGVGSSREAALSVLMYYQDLIYILTLRMDPEKRQPH
jgi:hypothetical protein